MHFQLGVFSEKSILMNRRLLFALRDSNASEQRLRTYQIRRNVTLLRLASTVTVILVTSDSYRSVTLFKAPVD